IENLYEFIIDLIFSVIIFIVLVGFIILCELSYAYRRKVMIFFYFLDWASDILNDCIVMFKSIFLFPIFWYV
ncbi:hypothetical protein ACJBSH_10555, partial [Streptococcus suis]